MYNAEGPFRPVSLSSGVSECTWISMRLGMRVVKKRTMKTPIEGIQFHLELRYIIRYQLLVASQHRCALETLPTNKQTITLQLVKYSAGTCTAMQGLI